jgi:hypothetical protein
MDVTTCEHLIKIMSAFNLVFEKGEKVEIYHKIIVKDCSTLSCRYRENWCCNSRLAYLWWKNASHWCNKIVLVKKSIFPFKISSLRIIKKIWTFPSRVQKMLRYFKQQSTSNWSFSIKIKQSSFRSIKELS